MTRRADPFARAQRRAMPPAEIRLWSCIRRGQLGWKFRRQVPIGPYYADFACVALRLVIECDGEQHGRDEGAIRDAARDAYLLRAGWDVLRLPNGLVLHRADDAIAAVVARCEERALFIHEG